MIIDQASSVHACTCIYIRTGTRIHGNVWCIRASDPVFRNRETETVAHVYMEVEHIEEVRVQLVSYLVVPTYCGEGEVQVF